MGKWVILIGNQQFGMQMIKEMRFDNAVRISEYGEKQMDVTYANGQISFGFDWDGSIRADYSPQELERLPFREPNMALLRYSDAGLLRSVIGAETFPKEALIDCDGVNLGLEQVVGTDRVLNAHGALDKERLSSIKLLRESGWDVARQMDLERIYAEHEERYRAYHRECDVPQVLLKDLFPAAREIVETLEGICIKNQHPELGLGAGSYAIEFGFFEYDISNAEELREMCLRAKERVVFIGLGYDIIGDWLVSERGAIYFWNDFSGRLHYMSDNIYDFLKCGIYRLRDREGVCIFDDEP